MRHLFFTAAFARLHGMRLAIPGAFRGKPAGTTKRVSDIWQLVLKALASGLLVVVFSLIAEAVRPRSFAGLFGAAPSIAIVSLILVETSKGAQAVREQSVAMMFGALTLAVYCVVATDAVDRFGGLRGSIAVFVAWFAVAGASWGLVLR